MTRLGQLYNIESMGLRLGNPGSRCVVAGGEQHRDAPEPGRPGVVALGFTALGFAASGFVCAIAGGEQHRGAPEPGRPGGAVCCGVIGLWL